ncbi:TcaA 3rd/4th domain-containing protein, partial [Clostridium tarantellae]
FKQAIILIFLSIFFSVFAYNNINSSKNTVIKEINIALKNSNERKLFKLIKINNINVDLNKKDLKPLINFFSEDKNRINNLVSNLEDNKSAYSLKIEKEQKIFKDKYFLQVNLLNIEVNSNLEGSDVYLNGVKKGTTDKNGLLIINNLVPGVYEIKLENKSKYSTVEKTEKIIVTENKKNNVFLDAINVTIKSNFPNGDVYINDKFSGLKVNEFKNIGPFSTNSSVALSVLADTPWGKIHTDNIYIKDYPEIKIDVNFKNDILNMEIKNFITEFYENVFKALNSEEKKDIEYCTDNVRDNIYNILRKKYFILKNKYSIDNLQIKLEHSEINFENNEYIGNIVVGVSYEVKKKILGIDLKKENFNESFFTKIKYENNKWIVYDIENFSLPNN